MSLPFCKSYPNKWFSQEVTRVKFLATNSAYGCHTWILRGESFICYNCGLSKEDCYGDPTCASTWRSTVFKLVALQAERVVSNQAYYPF